MGYVTTNMWNEDSNGNDYLTLVPTEKFGAKLKIIRSINKNSVDEKYMKIEFSMIYSEKIIRIVYNNSYPQVFLDDCLYKLAW